MRAMENTPEGLSAEIYAERGELLATVAVVALSQTGARLNVLGATRLPDQFIVKLDEDRILAARVRWRLIGELSVYFPERCAKIYKPEIDQRTVALVREIEALKRDLALHKAMSSV